MSENKTMSPPPLWHLSLARVLFCFLFIFFVYRTLASVVNIIYFASQPASAIQVSANESRYIFPGLFGYYRIPLDYLAVYDGITNGKLFALSITIAGFLFKDIPLLVIINLGRILFKNLKGSYTPFTAGTTSCIKKIGIIMICMGSLSKLLIQVSVNVVNLHRFNCVNPYEPSWILAGIFTFLLADIFARGCYLQQESDETL